MLLTKNIKDLAVTGTITIKDILETIIADNKRYAIDFQKSVETTRQYTTKYGNALTSFRQRLDAIIADLVILEIVIQSGYDNQTVLSLKLKGFLIDTALDLSSKDIQSIIGDDKYRNIVQTNGFKVLKEYDPKREQWSELNKKICSEDIVIRNTIISRLRKYSELY